MNDTAYRIQQTALKLFTEYGFEGTSLSDIAKEVGIKTPSIYAHYASKEQLFLRLVEDVIVEEREKWIAQMDGERVEQLSAKERLRLLFDFYTDFKGMSIGQAFLKRVMLAPPRGLDERLRQHILQYEEKITDDLHALLRAASEEAGTPPVNLNRQVAVIYALIDGLLVEFQLYDAKTHRERVEAVWEWLWNGIMRGD
ncbi:TetR family transcriptional regulator [Paenibacillus cellulosilyticus]|uniref:TetR family transcriptional regulator n=1 Tax=Paenibacillus cellulosilyticus TaxID=375489 RepID=A0A2V2Z8L4_9BACL|nr:TetR/AcrR family transcriptional regulator [Paenibacillus cellulosilyticus]PWW08451.1 TetR family transcriptional regulator [Paenibacillus cellulosilyticus]QKS48038.1 TetR/AcrR family transcriptional regulator [Paenibacillus cellulosilyticus]